MHVALLQFDFFQTIGYGFGVCCDFLAHGGFAVVKKRAASADSTGD
jgi:hypothetical protein